jgi:hypothetical protein
MDLDIKIYKIEDKDCVNIHELYEKLKLNISFYDWIIKHQPNIISEKYILLNEAQYLIDYYSIRNLFANFVNELGNSLFDPDKIEPYYVSKTGFIMYDLEEVFHLLPPATSQILNDIEMDTPKRHIFRVDGKIFVSHHALENIYSTYLRLLEEKKRFLTLN